MTWRFTNVLCAALIGALAAASVCATSVRAQSPDSPQPPRGISPQELEFLRNLRCKGRRPTALYYYRELQNLRVPLHFRNA